MKPYRILALADSDSYLKFACASVNGMHEWDRRIVVVRSPLQPTTAQIASAIAGTFVDDEPPAVVPLSRLGPAMAGADVILAAATGPVVEEIFAAAWRSPVRTPSRRPALVSALPGVALPAIARTVEYRRLGDAFITHSHAEQRAYEALTSALGQSQEVLAARLPFLHADRPPTPALEPITTIVFAPQAAVPEAAADRAHILRRLAAVSRARPDIDVIVKLRAWAGQPQTHAEPHRYDRIWATLTAEGVVSGRELSFRTGPVAGLLSPGTALVTVSSTAALEAIAGGLPVLILDDFGVGDSLLNGVFVGSGLLGSLDALSRCDFTHPREDWLADNYFHVAGTGLGQVLRRLAAHSRAGLLDPRGAVRPGGWRGRLHRRLRLVLPGPLAQAARRVREKTIAREN